MAKQIMEFPSEMIQKELEQDPSKLLNNINNIHQKSSNNKKNNPESKDTIINNKKIKTTDENKINKELNIFEKIKALDETEEKKDDNMNNILSSITDNKMNINYVKYINNINNINNQFIVNENIINNFFYMNGINSNNFNNIDNSNIIDNNYSSISNNNVNKNIYNNNRNIFCVNNKDILLNNTYFILKNLETHKGSILTQEFLNSLNDFELNKLFTNLTPYISSIMCLEYGNYFIQKLIKKLSIQQRLKIYELIEPNFIEIAINKSGTHSIQSLIDCIQSPLEYNYLDKLLSKNRLLFFLDENAYHIIMKIILEIDEDKRTNLNLFLVTNADKIITNVNGSFCVNKFIHKNNDIKLRALLVQNLKNNITKYINNKYSCTILLLILQKFGINYGLFIIQYIQQNFAILTKYSTTKVLILKTLNYLYKYNTFELGILIWFVYKNNVLLNYLLSCENGNQILKLMINISDEEQKKYILFKLQSVH